PPPRNFRLRHVQTRRYQGSELPLSGSTHFTSSEVAAADFQLTSGPTFHREASTPSACSVQLQCGFVSSPSLGAHELLAQVAPPFGEPRLDIWAQEPLHHDGLASRHVPWQLSVPL